MRCISISILNLCIYLVIFSNSLTAKSLFENAHDFDCYQETLSREEVEHKITTALQKHSEISNWYALEDTVFKMYASPEDKALDRPEFILKLGTKKKPFNKLPFFKNPHTPLKGLRVAIDPGHMGGELAKIEEKYIDMPPQPEQGIESKIQLNEGELTVLTSKQLARQLKFLGAEVLLTKTKAGNAVLKKDFSAWFKEDFEQAVSNLIQRQDNPAIQKKEELFWNTAATKTEIFKGTYNFLDIERRAELINAFNPHLTITCHFDLAGIYDANGQTPGSTDDHTLFFVPGAFQRGSLKDEQFRKSSLKHDRTRYEFVRLLVTDDLDQSVSLAKIAQGHAQEILRLPTGDHCNYLKVLCMKNSPGIYHRNLMLPRLVHGPILYCEPFCQDNYLQAKSLSENPQERISEMVEIYIRSVLDWVSNYNEANL